jgi:Skp family chaperone for outer membrane proteins
LKSLHPLLAASVSISLAAMIAGALPGCDQGKTDNSAAQPATPAKAAQTVGVLDIDKVAKQQGWDSEMQSTLKATDTAVKQEIQDKLQQIVNAVIQKRKDIAYDAKLTSDQMTALDNAKDREDLMKLGLTSKQIDDLVQGSAQIQTAQQQASNAYQQFMQQRLSAIRGAYRDALGPVIRRVADANDCSMVLLPSDSLIYYSETTDLTNKVIDELQKSPPLKVNLPDIPHPTATTLPASQP